MSLFPYEIEQFPNVDMEVLAPTGFIFGTPVMEMY